MKIRIETYLLFKIDFYGLILFYTRCFSRRRFNSRLIFFG